MLESRLPKEKKYIVALSGGADSVALLDILAKEGHSLIVAHFNHNLRGEESNEDEKFAKNLAKQYNLPFFRDGKLVKELSEKTKVSIETAARNARYGFFSELAKKEGIDNIVLAHHGDDQIETCMFNFFRGSGIAGLSGMKPVSSRIINNINVNLHRPLLNITKKEILEYINEKKLYFREDSSNKIADVSRNKIRLKIIPLIEDLLGGTFKKSILRNSRVLSDEEEYLTSLAKPLASLKELPTNELKALHIALRRRVVHTWLKNRGFKEPKLSDVEKVLSLIKNDKIAKINLPDGKHARRKEKKIFIESPEKKLEDYLR